MAGYSAGTANALKPNNAPNVNLEKSDQVVARPPKTSASFNMAGGSVLASMSDAVSGDLFKKMLYERVTPEQQRLDKFTGYLIDVSV